MTRALILAAGRGDRLRPLTDDRPKCLVELQGKTLLDRQLGTLSTCNVNDVHIVTGYQSPKIEALGIPVSRNSRYASTNMVASMFSARAFIDKKEDLIIAYGDIVYQKNNLESLLANSDEIGLMIDKNWRALWEMRFHDPLKDAETLLMDGNGYITELGKKPESYARIQGQYTGLIKLRADKVRGFIDFYDRLDRNKRYDGKDFDNMYMTSFLQALIDAGWKVKAVEVPGGWLEVDSVADLEKYENLAESGGLKVFYDPFL